MRHFISSCAAGLILSACSGSPEPVTYDGYRDEAKAIEQKLLDDGDLYLTPSASIPTSGEATYQGVIGFDAYRSGVMRQSYGGELSLTAHFDAAPGDMITGHADRFVDTADRPVDGRLEVTFGDIDNRADPVFEDQVLIDLDGKLIDHHDVLLDVSAQADGVFLGPSGRAIVGMVFGAMTSSYGFEVVEGGYIADR